MPRLLIRPGAIGDFILSLPAMECLRAGHTEVWAESRNLPLARFADRVRSIQATGLNLLGLPDVEPPARLIEELRGFDSIVSWYGARRPELHRAVESLRLPFRFLPAVPSEGSRLHATDFYMRQAAGIAGRAAEAVPRLPCARRDEGFVAIHPFSGSGRKNWPIERYRRLSEILAGRLPVRWILEPGAARPDGVEMEPPTPDLWELASRLARARLYIGNDSGITHLAAAAGAPVLALFGPTDPALWGPRGARVRVISAPSPGGAMDSIPLEGVLAAARDWCESPPEPSGQENSS